MAKRKPLSRGALPIAILLSSVSLPALGASDDPALPCAGPAKKACACESAADRDLLPENEIVEHVFSYGSFSLWGDETVRPRSTYIKVSTGETLDEFTVHRDVAGIRPFAEHLELLETYFGVLLYERKLSPALVATFVSSETVLPLDRTTLHAIFSAKGDLLGMIRLFDGSRKNTLFGRSPNATASSASEYAFPHERSLAKRGLVSAVADEYRNRYPEALLVEFGRAYRRSDTRQGEQAKAIWEVSMLASHAEAKAGEGGRKTFYFIHTDRLGARLFQKEYGAEVKETILPPKEPGGEWTLRKGAMRPDDPRDAEYLLVVSGETMAESIIRSYETVPAKIELLAKMEALRMRFEYWRRQLAPLPGP